MTPTADRLWSEPNHGYGDVLYAVVWGTDRRTRPGTIDPVCLQVFRLFGRTTRPSGGF